MRATRVYDLLQSALRERRGAVAGVLFADDDGACARFEVEWREGRVGAARYQCTTCATLVALCELIRREAVGMDAAGAAMIDGPWLLERLAEIPESRAGRAALAARAFRAALQIE